MREKRKRDKKHKELFFEVKITCAIVFIISISVGRRTNGRVSKRSGESIDERERESSQKWYLTKWLWRERTMEETDLLGHCYE